MGGTERGERGSPKLGEMGCTHAERKQELSAGFLWGTSNPTGNEAGTAATWSRN